MALQDVLAQALREAFLKDRLRGVTLWSLVVQGDASSNSGPLEIGRLTGAIADELAEVLKGKLEPGKEHTAAALVLPMEPPDVEPLDSGMDLPENCVATTAAGKPCKRKPSGDSLFCAWHQPK